MTNRLKFFAVAAFALSSFFACQLPAAELNNENTAEARPDAR